jgi:DNA polymerase-1
MSLKQPFLVVDGSYYLHRTFRGSDLEYSFGGIPVNAVKTSMATFRRVLEQIEPTRVAIVFDSGTPTFRHQLSSRYKAHRSPPPEELTAQIPYMLAAFSALGMQVVVRDGYEGDDLIGTIALQAASEGYFVIVSTGDKDMFQLVDQGIVIENPFTGMRFGREDVKSKMGVYPEQVVDYLALVGDVADGVQGVQGVGAKTASNLLSQFGSIDGIVDNLPNMVGRTPHLIGSSLESLKLDRVLTKIKTDVEIGLYPEDYRIQPLDRESVDALMDDLGYIFGYRLLNLLDRLCN